MPDHLWPLVVAPGDHNATSDLAFSNAGAFHLHNHDSKRLSRVSTTLHADKDDVFAVMIE